MCCKDNQRGCHPELVEGRAQRPLPTMLRQAQHDTPLNIYWLVNLCNFLLSGGRAMNFL